MVKSPLWIQIIIVATHPWSPRPHMYWRAAPRTGPNSWLIARGLSHNFRLQRTETSPWAMLEGRSWAESLKAVVIAKRPATATKSCNISKQNQGNIGHVSGNVQEDCEACGLRLREVIKTRSFKATQVKKRKFYSLASISFNWSYKFGVKAKTMALNRVWKNITHNILHSYCRTKSDMTDWFAWMII